MTGIRRFEIGDIEFNNSAGLITVHVAKSRQQGELPGSFVMNKSITLPISEVDLSPVHLIDILTILEKFWRGE